MIQFIIATHGKFALGIKDSINLIIGEVENLEILSCYIEKDFNLKKEILKLLNKYSNKKIIVITDIFGGSVNNEFLNYINEFKNLHVVSGLNLPLVLSLIENQNEYEEIVDLIESSIEDSNFSIKYCNKEIQEVSLPDQEF